ncbi:MAG: hypothetical protein CVT67_06745 [Actinobacteria bacterium HGW-Actinobacteria-7]|jgi:hypothetical protein|nr:MAG: hypothetical protein CVT67_06745 [Actinobacteria bacterium HGW-Actinobacteria-7]
MIISDEQAYMAATQLATSTYASIDTIGPKVGDDVIQRARLAALRAPDAREDRIMDAKTRLLAGLPNSTEIATKMVARILCDALR